MRGKQAGSASYTEQPETHGIPGLRKKTKTREDFDYQISLILSYLLAAVGLLALINVLIGPF